LPIEQVNAGVMLAPEPAYSATQMEKPPRLLPPLEVPVVVITVLSVRFPQNASSTLPLGTTTPVPRIAPVPVPGLVRETWAPLPTDPTPEYSSPTTYMSSPDVPVAVTVCETWVNDVLANISLTSPRTSLNDPGGLIGE
jgi:hypothetical protein